MVKVFISQSQGCVFNLTAKLLLPLPWFNPGFVNEIGLMETGRSPDGLHLYYHTLFLLIVFKDYNKGTKHSTTYKLICEQVIQLIKLNLPHQNHRSIHLFTYVHLVSLVFSLKNIGLMHMTSTFCFILPSFFLII